MALYDITTANNSLVYDTTSFNHFSDRSVIAIDSSIVVSFYRGQNNDGFTQVFSINTSTWEVTTGSAKFEYDISDGLSPNVVGIDANHMLVGWGDAGGSKVQVFEVNTTTLVISTSAATFTFVSAVSIDHPMIQVDTNHFLQLFRDGNDDGFAHVLEVNTTTWVVTTANSAIEIDTQNIFFASVEQIDTNHFLAVWRGDATATEGIAQVLEVNTSTWAVTTAGAKFTYSAFANSVSTCKIDTNHFAVFYNATTGDLDGSTVILEVNTSTWAVTTANTPLLFSANGGGYNSCNTIDSNHFVNFYSGTDADGFAQVFTVNTSTWAITTSSAVLEFDTSNNLTNSSIVLSDEYIINTWLSGSSMKAQVFNVDLPSGTTFVPIISMF